MENKYQSSISTALDNFSKFKLYIYIYQPFKKYIFDKVGKKNPKNKTMKK